jgi:phosphatidylserine/phosphatidylglycerophosphate/cardiolipin synthase-like enzyme
MKKLILTLVVLLSLQAGLSAGTEVFFSPEGNIQAEIVNRISRSTKSVDAMIYCLTVKRIASALVYAKERGLAVRVIADRSQSKGKSSYIGFLISKGVKVKMISGIGKGAMHNTTGIFDGNELVTGSYAWNASAEYNNYENAIFTDDKTAVRKYQDQFEMIWRTGK